MLPTNPKQKRKKPAEPKVSRTQLPANMTLEEWQTHLRRQFGRAQNFTLKNVGPNPAFSDFLVSNPESRRTYRVTVRGTTLGDNACTCPDFAAKTLGTRKHVEFVLAKLERSKKARAELKAGYQPAHTEVVLRYGSRRQVCFHPSAELVRTDEKTGEPYLRLPVPPPQVLNQAVEMLSRLLGNLRNR